MTLALSPKQRERFDYFIIWGNGASRIEEILDPLRAETDLQIVMIESRHIDDMERFVFDLYASDTVPIEHLRAKLRYLYDVPPEIVVVFVRNLSPEEEFTGEGAFRKVQCQTINRIKWRIREDFNPRVGGRRSEEHVIHASDYEEQVDYLLKYLGYPMGIRYLEEGNKVLPFRKPCHIPMPSGYAFRNLPLSALQASVLREGRAQKVYVDALPISQTPHYRALTGHQEEYTEYLVRFRYTYLKDNYSWSRFHRLSRLSREELLQLDPILVIPTEGNYRILDGVHRAAIALFHQIDTIQCIELTF